MIYYTPTEPTDWGTEPTKVGGALDTLADTLLSLVGARDIEFTPVDTGFILRSANGKRWRLLLDGTQLTTQEVT